MKRGFTLIEVLIVVIILGILATLALPQFTKMTRRARMAEAWAGLGGVRTAEAVYYMENNAYRAGMATGVLDFNAPSANFTYTVVSPSAAIFTAFAQGLTTSADFSGMSAWVTNSGTRGSGGV